jgi:hypothetical protein
MIFKRIQSSTKQFWDQSEYLTLYRYLSIVYLNHPQIFQAGNPENNWATDADQLDLVPSFGLPVAVNPIDTSYPPCQNICSVSPL